MVIAAVGTLVTVGGGIVDGTIAATGVQEAKMVTKTKE